MNVGAILDFVAGELDAQVLGYMQEYAIPPSLMDKVLDRIQSHMRQMKSEEYAQELKALQLEKAMQQGTETARAVDTKKLEEPAEPQAGTETDTIEGFKEKMGLKEGERKDADIQRTPGKQGKVHTAI